MGKYTKKIPWKSGRCLRVGCVSTRRGLGWLRRRADRFDLIEVRLDSLKKEGVKFERMERTLRNRRRPVLLTLRTVFEGGSYPWKARERVRLFKKLIPHVDAIDIELANVKLLEPILDQAREQRCSIVLSAHSVKRKLTLRKIRRFLKEFQLYHANVYKIAGLARTQADLGVLVKTLMAHPKLPLAVMAIGPMAAISRVVLPAFGSRLVYGYLDEPAAKNQPSIQEISDQLEDLEI